MEKKRNITKVNLALSTWRFFALKHLSRLKKSDYGRRVLSVVRFKKNNPTTFSQLKYLVESELADYQYNGRGYIYKPFKIVRELYPDLEPIVITKAEEPFDSYKQFIVSEIKRDLSSNEEDKREGVCVLVFAENESELYIRFQFDHGILDGVHMVDILNRLDLKFRSSGLVPLYPDSEFEVKEQGYQYKYLVEDGEKGYYWKFLHNNLSEGSSGMHMVAVEDDWNTLLTIALVKYNPSLEQFISINRKIVENIRSGKLNYYQTLFTLHRKIKLFQWSYKCSNIYVGLYPYLVCKIVLAKKLFSKMDLPYGYIVFSLCHQKQKESYLIHNLYKNKFVVTFVGKAK